MKTFVNLLSVVLCTVLFLISFCGISCAITPEGISILSGNYESPKILELKVLSENSINLTFSTPINFESLQILEEQSHKQISLIHHDLGKGKWKIDSEQSFDCTKTYIIEGYVLDGRKNSLYFKDSFIGYNARVPKVVINEIRTEYSKPKVEFIELKVLSDGNLGGMELLVASDEDSYILPAVEVKSGDLVVIHYRNIEDGCVDEVKDDLSLSTATESSEARDLWLKNEKARIAKSDVILLKDKLEGDIVDSLLFCDSSFTSWKTEFLSQCADVALSSETWIGNPVISDGVTATRTLSRVNFNKDASAWIVTATSKASPGKENSTQAYAK